MNELNPEFWLDRYGDYLYSIAYLKLRNKESAEDLVQETLLSAFRAQKDFKGKSSERTWLTAILKNKVVDNHRRKDVLREVAVYLSDTETAFLESFFDLSPDSEGHWLTHKAPGNWVIDDALLDNSDLSPLIRFCLSKLPSRLSAIFLARFIDEENSDKICKQFGISPSNYWVILHRGKVLMRECLAKQRFEK